MCSTRVGTAGGKPACSRRSREMLQDRWRGPGCPVDMADAAAIALGQALRARPGRGRGGGRPPRSRPGRARQAGLAVRGLLERREGLAGHRRALGDGAGHPAAPRGSSMGEGPNGARPWKVPAATLAAGWRGPRPGPTRDGASPSSPGRSRSPARPAWAPCATGAASPAQRDGGRFTMSVSQVSRCPTGGTVGCGRAGGRGNGHQGSDGRDRTC